MSTVMGEIRIHDDLESILAKKERTSAGAQPRVEGVAANGRLFVIGSEANGLYYSEDNLATVYQSNVTTGEYEAIVYARSQGAFYAMENNATGGDSRVYRSTDGKTWTLSDTVRSKLVWGICETKGHVFVPVRSSVNDGEAVVARYTKDGTTWTDVKATGTHDVNVQYLFPYKDGFVAVVTDVSYWPYMIYFQVIPYVTTEGTEGIIVERKGEYSGTGINNIFAAVERDGIAYVAGEIGNKVAAVSFADGTYAPSWTEIGTFPSIPRSLAFAGDALYIGLRSNNVAKYEGGTVTQDALAITERIDKLLAREEDGKSILYAFGRKPGTDNGLMDRVDLSVDPPTIADKSTNVSVDKVLSKADWSDKLTAVANLPSEEQTAERIIEILKNA